MLHPNIQISEINHLTSQHWCSCDMFCFLSDGSCLPFGISSGIDIIIWNMWSFMFCGWNKLSRFWSCLSAKDWFGESSCNFCSSYSRGCCNQSILGCCQSGPSLSCLLTILMVYLFVYLWAKESIWKNGHYKTHQISWYRMLQWHCYLEWDMQE